MVVNIQKPFAFEAKQKQKKPKLLQPAAEGYMPVNIKGICSFCGSRYQKVRKFDKTGKPLLAYWCVKCLKIGRKALVKEFPKELIPWYIPPISHTRDFSFTCTLCNEYRYSWRILGSLCGHKTHTPPTGYACRFCCTKVKKINKTLTPEPPIQPESPIQSDDTAWDPAFWGTIPPRRLHRVFEGYTFSINGTSNNPPGGILSNGPAPDGLDDEEPF